MTDLKNKIIEVLHRTDSPVLTVEQLAEEIEESASEIEEAVADLEAENKIETEEIGGEKAYHIHVRDHPTHRKPDHYCTKCGREVHDRMDSARVELEGFFTNRRTANDVINRQVLCRFCYHDLVCWLHNDEELMHVYPHLDEWDVPEYQKEEVEQSSEHHTAYSGEE